ncbi:MAG: RsmE family RNA methyltransferase [Armatimonadota bacterium]|nr:16S rRNA (uracil(1498)-N(3))-methyltransferase [Armatimonadota bacterium]MDW8290142.1 RsmE family RNA methyltransferase [Armatimonadota bacterium]
MPKHRFFVSPEQFSDGIVRIVGEDARQIRVVLRLQRGDEVGVLDGSGREYRCVLEQVSVGEVLARVASWELIPQDAEMHITVIQALAKGDKVEQVIQHGTEIGVSRFVLVQTERSVMRLDGERARSRVERWRRIAKEAAEQAHCLRIPEVEGVWSLPYALRQMGETPLLALHPDESCSSLADWVRARPVLEAVALVVGPEGGLTEEEVRLCQQHGATCVSLMRRILRTETAALVAVSQLLIAASLWQSEPR